MLALFINDSLIIDMSYNVCMLTSLSWSWLLK